jgi:aquaporin rerated protein, invertebrate
MPAQIAGKRELLGKVVAEFIGTAFLVFMVSGSVVIPTAYMQEVPRAFCSSSSSSYLVTAFIQGFSLMAVVFTFADISGSHFNPAITLTFVILGSFGILLGLAYIACQVAGAIVGAYIFRWTVERYLLGQAGATLPNVDVGIDRWQAFVIEVVITSMLLFVVVSTSFNLKNGLPSVRPLPIGFSVVAGVLFAGALTGASMNPVRSLGPAIVASAWRSHYIYWLAALTSSVFVGTAYRYLFQTAVSPLEGSLLQ